MAGSLDILSPQQPKIINFFVTFLSKKLNFVVKMQQSHLQAILFDELISKAISHAGNIVGDTSFFGLALIQSIR